MTIKITGIHITNFRGIEAREIEVPPAGFAAVGANGKGKTTIIRAIRAALLGQDIGPDAIRIGADKAEILIDLGEFHAKRVITPKTSTLTVTKGEEGFRAAKPQTLLTELLGTSVLDPLDLFLAKPKERRAKILEALPVRVTRDDLLTYAPELPADFKIFDGEHGLEVIARARKIFYDARTEANRVAAEAKRQEEAAKKVREECGVTFKAASAGVDIIAVATAERELQEAERVAIELDARAKEAGAAAERTREQRERAKRLREQADVSVMGLGQESEPVRELVLEHESLLAHIVELEKKLAAAKERFQSVVSELDAVRTRNTRREETLARAEELRSQAASIESALEAAGVAPPSEDEVNAAAAKIAAAKKVVEVAKMAEAVAFAERELQKLSGARKAADEKATALDVVVQKLTDEAPKKLLAESSAIPGLSLDGDEVLLDGKRLDALCGNEQLKLAIEIARRANAKSKILVVDKLEALDPDQFELFVREATRDDYQLIGTRVDRGEIRIEAFTYEDEGAVAAE